MSLETKAYSNLFLQKLILFILIIVSCCSQAEENSQWNSLEKGLKYRDIGSSLLKPWAHIHVFKINLNDYKFSLLTAENLSKKNAGINEYAQFSNALLAFNGGFFDHSYRPLGLRISNHRQKNPLKKISWWGIFFIKNNKPFINSVYNFYRNRQIDFAIQSGPRLIINNKIPSLKPGVAERTALGITKDKQVVILITDNYSMSTSELAHIMKSHPLNCTDALNLDGGKSTQLYANISSFKLSVHGYSHISDAVIIKKKK